MNRDYTCEIMKTLKENGNQYTWGNVTVKLAEASGFCWGVERLSRLLKKRENSFQMKRFGLQTRLFTTPLLISI